MAQQYKLLIGDTDASEIRVPATGDDSYLAPVTLDAATGDEVAFEIDATVNQSGDAGYTALRVNATESATGSGTGLIADFQVGGVSKAHITNTGKLVLDPAGAFGAANTGLWFGDGDTGIFQESDDNLVFWIAGANTFRLGIGTFGSYVTSGFGIFNINASATAPTLSPNKSDTNTGIGSAASDQLSLIAGGVEVLRCVEDTGNAIMLATATTVAGLPVTPAAGMIARVSDASAPAIGSTVAGGGAAYALVNYNGSNWTVIGI